MPAEISAGDLFPVPPFVQEQDPVKAGERHRNLIAQALNEVASAAFSPQIIGDVSATSQDTTTSYVAYSGLTLSIVSPVPASALFVSMFDVRAKTWVSGNGNFQATLNVGAPALASSEWSPAAVGERSPFLMVAYSNSLLPRTEYIVTVFVRTSASGTNVYTVNTAAAGTRAVLAAVVLPRLL